MLSMFALWYFYVAIMIEIFKVSRGSFLNTVITYQPSKSPIAAAAQAAAERLGAPEPEFGSNNQRSGSSTLTTIERQAMVKICMYMLACFVQYLPGIPYAVSFVAPSQPYILYCLAIISINCGGLVNATALILNEGLSVRQQQPSTQQSSSNWIYPAQSPRIPNKRNSFSVSRSQFSVNFAPTASGSHFRPPSFQGMQLSVMPQSGSHISQGSVDPYSTGNNHYPGPSFDSHQKVPSDVGAPSNMASSFDAMWDRLGPQAATTRSPNVAAPIPLRISQDTGVRRSADHNHGSEYPPMVDHVGMRDISHAYANIAQQQQRNAGRNSGSFH
ncbi:hypothetical protein BJ742DRAFT_557291 [Cladochytrium replicatum]|nr:hypothetical protein BJ742DRAFT_557291 [Cladochytrium replicatum]